VQEKIDEVDVDFVQSDLPKLLSSLEVGTERIRSIVLSLRIFSRLHESDIKAVDLHDGIDSTLIILNSRLKAQPDRPEIKLTKQYGDLPLVDCYAGQMNQVFMNLLANAIDALEEQYHKLQLTNSDWQPEILIRTQATHDQVKIEIADNGSGIPEQIQSKIFDPFFTTKKVGQGTGLGMSISYEIVVEKHNGSLDFVSTANEGTSFIVQLPIKLQS
jgi:signal transduction histidine kinase